MTSAPRSRSTALAVILVTVSALAAGFCGTSFLLTTGTTAATETGVFAERGITLPDVRLIDQNGTERALASEIARDALLVVNFNYTTCASICPVGNALMQALDREGPSQLDKPVKLLSITLDPRTDTPGVLRRAAAEYDPSGRWLWLTGAPADVASGLAETGAEVSDITLHSPLFLVGDAETGIFYRIRKQPDAKEVLETLAKLRQ